jgi:hypothetical protein
MHFVHEHAPFILAAVFPGVLPFAVDYVFFEIADVGAFAFLDEFTFTMFHATAVKAFVGAVVGPDFCAEAMLLVHVPLAFEFGAVNVIEGADPLSMIVDPVALIYRPVGVDESTLSMLLVIAPLAFVLLAIFLHQNATAFPESLIGPLTAIDISISHEDGSFDEQFRVNRLHEFKLSS